MHKTSWYITDDVIPMDNFGFGIYADGYADIFGVYVHTADTKYSEVAAFWADNAAIYNSDGNPAENSYFLSKKWLEHVLPRPRLQIFRLTCTRFIDLLHACGARS